MTKYQHLKYCPVTLKFPQLGIHGTIKSIGKQVPYFLFPQPAGFQASHSQDFSVLWDMKSQCVPLLGEFGQKSLTYFVLVPHKPPGAVKEPPLLTTSAPTLAAHCMKEKPEELDIAPSGVWDWEGEVVR